jgi:RNA polymerase sigma factor (sigma-70 family)
MTLPSPSDHCWVIGSTPQGRWIAPLLCAAVESEWKEAHRIAATHLSDQTLAPELMELAIQQTAEYLAELSPVGLDDVRAVLLRFYKNAVKRRQNAGRRLSYRGTASELEALAPSVPSASMAVESKADLSAILLETPAGIRHAMLLRYGARSTWREVAQEMSKSEEAVRKSCQRELNHIRARLGLKERAK